MIGRRLIPLLAAMASISLVTDPSPPNDLWPVRRLVDLRPGCHVLNIASYNPSWDEIVDWLAQCPTLTDIETFWVFDGRVWQLLVTGVARDPERVPVTVRIPAGTITYDEAPFARREVPDHGYVDVQVELSPEQAESIQRERTTMSAGYRLAEFEEPQIPAAPLYDVRQHPIRVDYVALMPDGSLETVCRRAQPAADWIISYAAPAIGSIEAADRAMQRLSVRATSESFDRYIHRGQQRANRKRRAARKRKRGWA